MVALGKCSHVCTHSYTLAFAYTRRARIHIWILAHTRSPPLQSDLAQSFLGGPRLGIIRLESRRIFSVCALKIVSEITAYHSVLGGGGYSPSLPHRKRSFVGPSAHVMRVICEIYPFVCAGVWRKPYRASSVRNFPVEIWRAHTHTHT